MRGGSHGTNVHNDVNTRTPRMISPFLPWQMLKWFNDISTGPANRATRCGLLLEGLSLLSSQLWRKHGGYEDLCGSDHWSVTPYVYGRCVYDVVQG
jgi:hypothetical protein